jgi:ABC-type xylose transport system permease subunit
MAALLGGLPSFVTILLTLFIGLLLGTIGGWIGSALKSTRDKGNG